ncbi:Transcription factor [Niveomyces insectorum RCEF 264]|uniref:Transcription factor n=1 Tax=Niveomyces insectorum RCEF 264 TaxID=1081102 RepID=A0A167SLB3_9HYPO|nr:Transcription factor [Niveomyces insectorum RCEF 264]
MTTAAAKQRLASRSDPDAASRPGSNADFPESGRPVKKPRKQRLCFSCEGRMPPPEDAMRQAGQRVSFCTRATAPSRASSGPSESDPVQPPKSTVDPVGNRAGSNNNPAVFLGFQHDGLNALLACTTEPLPSRVAPATCTPLDMPSRSTLGLLLSPSQANGAANPNGPGQEDNGNASERLDNVEQNGSYGTLMMSRGGRSRYLGPTAGSEWLKNSQMQDNSCTPSVTRSPSPEVPQPPGSTVSGSLTLHASPIAFPFNASAAHIRTRDVLAQLPPADEAWLLVESYYRYCAWHHDVAPKARFKTTFDRVYSLAAGGSTLPSPPVNFQEIALVFMIMAKGTAYNIEMPPNDSSAEDWLHLAEMALVKGDFLSNNTLAGVQTLHLMAHVNLQSDDGRHDDKAWSLWGIVMRLVQAMGLHRDGARWNLPQDIVEERRKVFWECNAADIFQAHCFSRPCAINPDHCDTAFPSEATTVTGEKGYYRLRFELSQLSSEILNMAMKARRPPYTEVTEMDLKLRGFEQNLPFYIRCRAAFVAMPSRYPRVEDAIEASPEPSRRSMTISFQTVINLHRPYYAKALYEDTGGSDRSIYAPSFYAVIERCAIIIAVVTDINARFPAVSTRQWNFWYHVFGSALCVGTLVLRHPGHPMAAFVLSQIDAAIALFTSLVQNGASTPRYQRNLQWLQKLRSRAAAKMATVSAQNVQHAQNTASMAEAHTDQAAEDGEDVELIGWRTRLIRQADRHRQTTSSKMPGLAADNTTPNMVASNTPNGSVNDGLMVPNQTLPQSTDDLLHEFWDPIILHDLLEVTNEQQPNYLVNNGPAWWEDGAMVPDVT